MNDVDLRALLDAVRSAKDGEFVSVQSRENDVRVAKQGGYLVVHVRDHKRSEEHTSELQSRLHLVCRLLLEKKKKKKETYYMIKSENTNEHQLMRAVRGTTSE